jgi:hypothetical protein
LCAHYKILIGNESLSRRVSYGIYCCWEEIVSKATKVSYFFLNAAGLDCKVSCILKVLEFSTTGLKKNSKTSTDFFFKLIQFMPKSPMYCRIHLQLSRIYNQRPVRMPPE